MKTHVAIFGNTAILRTFCGSCRVYALIDKTGHRLCCGILHKDPPTKIKRIVTPEQVRRLPPISARRAVLEAQEGRCFYCSRLIGSYVFRKGKWSKLLLHWDHWVPFSFTQNNHKENFVGACHLCNLKKKNMIFQTVEEAVVYLRSIDDVTAVSGSSPVSAIGKDSARHSAD